MLRYFLIILLSFFLFTLVYSLPYLRNKVFETEKPILLIKNLPKGFGNITDNLVLALKDNNSGLDSVVIRLFKGSERITLYKKKYKKNKRKSEINISLSAKKLDLSKGIARIQIRAFDNSFWNNKVEQNIDLEVDFNAPKIEVLSSQHNIRRNGSQLILYRVNDTNLYNHGVRSENIFYEGFKASFLDKALNNKNLYASFFSVSNNAKKENIKLYAEDRVGNFETKSFSLKILKSYTKKINKKYRGDKDLKNLITEKYKTELASVLNYKEKNIYPTQINSEFLRFPGTINTVFGNKINFFQKNKENIFLFSKFNEVNLKEYKNKVISLNDAIVAEVALNNFFGKYIILNHGASIYSFYGNLKKSFVNKNDKIEKGDLIGEVGSNLALINGSIIKDKSLYFMQLIGKNSVEPKEWWDENWYKSHIKSKIQKLKAELGLIEISRGL